MTQRDDETAEGLYYASLGKAVLEYTGLIHPEVMEKAMESRAVRTLEAIRRVLEDERYDDPECFERVDALVMLYYRELGVSVNRHNELE